MSTAPATTDCEKRHIQFEGRLERVDGFLGRFGDHLLIDRLGCGTMGLVYRAEKTGNPQRNVALKVFQPAIEKPESRERFTRESSRVAKDFDDNIMPILDVGEVNGMPFFTMPYVQGQTLEESINNELLPIPRVIELGIEIAQGLAAAHDKLGLIHRDLKPSNIWIMSTGSVKILDFGHALPLVQDPNQVRLTTAGVFIGTPNYSSPEQASAQQGYDHRSDLFSLGTLLYRLTVGQLPFVESSVAETLIEILRKDPVPANEANNRVPARMSDVIRKLMEKDPANRYATAELVISDMREILNQERQDTSDFPAFSFPTKPNEFAASVLEVNETDVRRPMGNVVALTATKLATRQLRGALYGFLYFLETLQDEMNREPPLQLDEIQKRVRKTVVEHSNRTDHVRVPADLSADTDEIGKALGRFVSDVIGLQSDVGDNFETALTTFIATVRRDLEPRRSKLEEVFNSVADTLRQVSSG